MENRKYIMISNFFSQYVDIFLHFKHSEYLRNMNNMLFFSIQAIVINNNT